MSGGDITYRDLSTWRA